MNAETMKVANNLQNRIVSLKQAMEDFHSKFLSNPTYELSWSETVFQKAAQLKVTQLMLNALTKEDSKATLESLRLHAQTQAIRGARFGTHSTSITSNLIESYETAAWAEASVDLGILDPNS